MTIAALGFAAHSIEVLLGALFLMGVHSTFFAPAKYGLLPEVLRRHGAGRRQRAGRDGHVPRDPARHARSPACWRRDGGIGAIATALIGVAAARLRDQPRNPGAASRRAGPAHRLAAVDIDVGQHPRRARIARRVPVDPRHLVVLVLRRAGARAAAAVREERARRQRADRHAAARAVLGRHRHRLAAVRTPVRPQGRDRPGAVRLDRPDGVRGRSVLRGAALACRHRADAPRSSSRCPDRGACCSTSD